MRESGDVASLLGDAPRRHAGPTLPTQPGPPPQEQLPQVRGEPTPPTGTLSLRAEVALAARQARQVSVEACTTLSWAHRSSWRTTVLVIWAISIVIDAVTTVLLLQRPGFVEANPVAAAGMGAFGSVGYVAAVCLVCTGWALLAASPTKGAYAQTLSGVAVALGVGKLAIGTHNLLLLVG